MDSTRLYSTQLDSTRFSSTQLVNSAPLGSTQLSSTRLDSTQINSIQFHIILFCSTLLYLWLAKSGHLALAPRFANVANDVTDQQGRMTGSEQKHLHLSNLLLQLLLQKGHDLD